MRLNVPTGRILVLVLCTALGVGLGLLDDLLGGNLGAVSCRYIMDALILSPIVVSLGGMGVTLPGMGLAFFVGGILFWPGYAALVWFWFRRPSMLMPVLIVFWTTQGYFQLLHRLQVLMSV